MRSLQILAHRVFYQLPFLGSPEPKREALKAAKVRSEGDSHVSFIRRVASKDVEYALDDAAAVVTASLFKFGNLRSAPLIVSNWILLHIWDRKPFFGPSSSEENIFIFEVGQICANHCPDWHCTNWPVALQIKFNKPSRSPLLVRALDCVRVYFFLDIDCETCCEVQLRQGKLSEAPLVLENCLIEPSAFIANEVNGLSQKEPGPYPANQSIVGELVENLEVKLLIIFNKRQKNDTNAKGCPDLAALILARTTHQFDKPILSLPFEKAHLFF